MRALLAVVGLPRVGHSSFYDGFRGSGAVQGRLAKLSWVCHGGLVSTNMFVCLLVQFVQQLGLTPEELQMMGGVEPREKDSFILEVELVRVEDRQFSTQHFPLAKHLTGKTPLKLKEKVRFVHGSVVVELEL